MVILRKRERGKPARGLTSANEIGLIGSVPRERLHTLTNIVAKSQYYQTKVTCYIRVNKKKEKETACRTN